MVHEPSGPAPGDGVPSADGAPTGDREAGPDRSTPDGPVSGRGLAGGTGPDGPTSGGQAPRRTPPRRTVSGGGASGGAARGRGEPPPAEFDPWAAIRRPTLAERMVDRLERRRARIRRELQSGGDARIPTWVFVVALVGFVAAWVLFVALA